MEESSQTESISTGEIIPRWFQATDVPKRDETPYKMKKETGNKNPTDWKPFTPSESSAIEDLYQNLLVKSSSTNFPIADSFESRVAVGTDHLYEVNVETRELYPIYWEGAVYEIRRGIWFMSVGSKFQPCDENLSRQLEEGYKKFHVQLAEAAAKAKASANKSPMSVEKALDEKPTESSGTSVKSPEYRWALFGPHMNHFVVYSSPTLAWLQSDELASKLSRAVMYSAGTKLVRGWDQVLSIQSKSSTAIPTRPKSRPILGGSPSLSEVSLENNLEDVVAAVEALETAPEAKEQEPYQKRKIDHLILVIHGIGQKFGERVETTTLTQDCNAVRDGLKSCTKYVQDLAKTQSPEHNKPIPDHGGVQVLPIQWRKRLKVKLTGEDEAHQAPTVQDITLEGIPGIRHLVSDVVLDVLLYLSPKYRQDMILHVTAECNRVYRLYKALNPDFEGTVSLYGHSLGSVLAYDIVTHQPDLIGMSRNAARHDVDLSDLMVETGGDYKIEGLYDLKSPVTYQPLDFDVNKLFAVGSPLGMILLLRGEHLVSIKDKVQHFFNIFHPFDPVAYRLEPLVNKTMSQVKPCTIPYTQAGLTKAIVGIQETGRSIYDSFSGMMGGALSLPSRVLTMVTAQRGISPDRRQTSNPEPPSFGIQTDDNDKGPETTKVEATQQIPSKHAQVQGSPKGKDVLPSAHSAATGMTSAMGSSKLSVPNLPYAGEPGKSATSASTNSNDPTDDASDLLATFNLAGRIDFALQEGVLENPYLSALGSHVNYWSNPDCNAFVLQSLYDLPLASTSTKNKRLSQTLSVSKNME